MKSSQPWEKGSSKKNPQHFVFIPKMSLLSRLGTFLYCNIFLEAFPWLLLTSFLPGGRNKSLIRKYFELFNHIFNLYEL